MTSFEVYSLTLGAINAGVIIFLTYRMTKANETLTQLQVKFQNQEQPELVAWVRNIDDKSKELALINLGKNDLLIPYISIKINGQTCDWISPVQQNGITTQFDKGSLCNIALKNGHINCYSFGSNTYGGMYGGELILHNMQGEVTILHFNMSKYGPYKLDQQKFFHY